MRKTSRNILNDKNHTFVIAEVGQIGELEILKQVLNVQKNDTYC